MFRIIYFVCFILLSGVGLLGQQVVDAIPFSATGPCGISQTIVHDQGIFVTLKYRGTLDAFGQTFGTGNQDDLILFSLDPSGDLLWYIEAGSNSDDNSVDLKYDVTNERLYWTGMFWDKLDIGDESYDISIGSRGIFLVAVNAGTGESDWVRVLMGPSQKQISALAVDDHGNLFCTGYYQNTLVVNDQLTLMADRMTYLFVLKYNQSGDVILHKNFGGDADIRPVDCVSDGQSVFIGGTLKGRVNFDRDTLTGRLLDTDIFLFRLDANGQNPWAIVAGGVYDKFVSDLIWSNDKIYMAGYFMGVIELRSGFVIQTNGLNIDGFVATFDQEGNALDATTISGPGAIFTSDISKKNGELMLSGSWDGSIFDDTGEQVFAPSGTRQGFVIRLSSDLEKLEFTQFSTSGFVSDLHFRHRSEGMEFLSLTFSENVSLGDQEWVSQGAFEGLLLKFDVLSSDDQFVFEDKIPILFPNPVQDRLHCEGCFGMDYSIVDTQGRIVHQQKYQQDIDVSRLVSGLYILVLHDGRGGALSLRFVKQ